MSANEIDVLEIAEAHNAAPDHPPLPAAFRELDIVSDGLGEHALTVFFQQDDARDGDLEAYYRIESRHVVDLKEER